MHVGVGTPGIFKVLPEAAAGDSLIELRRTDIEGVTFTDQLIAPAAEITQQDRSLKQCPGIGGWIRSSLVETVGLVRSHIRDWCGNLCFIIRHRRLVLSNRG